MLRVKLQEGKKRNKLEAPSYLQRIKWTVGLKLERKSSNMRKYFITKL